MKAKWLAYSAAIVGLLCVAEISVCQSQNAAQVIRSRIVKAKPLPLYAVRLLSGPLKSAQDLDADYLLDLQPDRMLAFLRQRAGLTPKARPYGGWDGAGRQLTGHIAGHYLSAVSLMWAATGDGRFKGRADYIVAQLKEIQEKQGDGYIGALLDKEGVDGKVRFEDLCKGSITSSGFDLNGLWSPWYVEHKIFAGLRDAYRYAGNRTALEVETKFAAWTEHILAQLSDEQLQKMLNTEFGGMNEVTVDLYADTGDPRWLALSDKFQHHAIIDPLSQGKDILEGKHGNTQVPKLLGSLERYLYSGNEADYKAAEFFWTQVALHHSFATGGHGKNEYFGPPDSLNTMVDGRTAETCNVYNMLKLTRELFSVKPDIRYADFHERALFNHILASQDPADGRVCYMVPVGRGVQHEYQDKEEDFTCCVGTGMESHALHGYGIYYESGNKLWVNLYVASEANWDAAGVKLSMNTDFPAGENASLRLTLNVPKKFTLALRRPYWAGSGFRVSVNGKAIEDLPPADSYVEIDRTWKAGDNVELVMPKTLHAEPLPDNPIRQAALWGPLVLAGDLGPEVKLNADDEQGPPPQAPVLVVANTGVQSWLRPVTGKPGAFRTSNAGLAADIDFVPFYKLPRRRYAIYWDVFTPAEWKKQAETYAEEEARKAKLQAATVAFAQPGQMQAERDFNQQGEETTPIQTSGRYGRRGTKWFSFDLPVEPAHPMTLIVTYGSDMRRGGTFAVLVDGTKIGEQQTERRSPEQGARFFDVEYALPAALVQGRNRVTVRFEAAPGNEISGIYGIRMVRGDANPER
jgi:DUF1680 family protein